MSETHGPLSLTADQLQAVHAKDSRVLLVAPAGSGKTEVLARRVERILSDSPGQAFRILIVAYTVKAAEEIRDRVRMLAGGEAWRVDAETIHGFALDWLARHGAPVGIDAEVTVYSDDIDRVGVLSGCVQALRASRGLPAPTPAALMSALRRLDQFRTTQTGQPSQDETIADLELPLADVLDEYTAALSNAHGIDFPGMLARLTELFEADPWVLKNFQSSYRHVLVDEGQDLTPAQVRVLRALVSEKVDLFVVADDRQSINEFAGGSFKNAQGLVGKPSVTLELRHNFRCARAVLAAAERVASALSSVQHSSEAQGAAPGEVIISPSESSAKEASVVCDWIDGLLSKGLPPNAITPGEDPTTKPEDIAVIGRSRWVLDSIIQELTMRACPMSVNLDPSDHLATPYGRVWLESLNILADSNDKPSIRRLREALDQIDPTLAELMPAAFAVAEDPELSKIGRHIETARANLDRLAGGVATEFSDSPWSGDAITLSDLWRDYRSRTNAQDRTLKGYLRFVSRAQFAKASDPGVRVLTIHRVKGLEFKAVAIVGAHEGSLPDYRAKSDRELDAERRSLYVAMTRARRVLHISWPQRTIDRYGRARSQRPSSFLTQSGLVAE